MVVLVVPCCKVSSKCVERLDPHAMKRKFLGFGGYRGKAGETTVGKVMRLSGVLQYSVLEVFETQNSRYEGYLKISNRFSIRKQQLPFIRQAALQKEQQEVQYIHTLPAGLCKSHL